MIEKTSDCIDTQVKWNNDKSLFTNEMIKTQRILQK